MSKTHVNDSIIISKHSLFSFKVHELALVRPNTMFDNQVDSLIYETNNVGEIIGPFENDSIMIEYKIASIDSSWVFNVGNIFIKSDSSTSYSLANKIIRAYNYENKSFDELCKTYSMDNNQNLNCDIGLIFEGYLLKDFEKEVLLHKKDDVFITTTRFGIHVVKLLDNNIKKKCRVKYTSLTLRKK